MGDKNQIQLSPIISWVLGVGILAFIIVILAIIFNVIPSDAITFSTTGSSNDTILVEATSTLSPIARGITSNSVIANEFTWLTFDGVNDVINTTLDFEQENFTAIAWIKIPALSNGSKIFFNNYNTGFARRKAKVA